MYKDFSHIYIEKGVLHHPYCKNIIDKFPKSNLIEIDDYSDFFNRSRQDWRLQKTATKLIIAAKKSDFLYTGSPMTPSFEHVNFYYNTLAMNCIYDCHYCYLQGMYPSANMVFFVNIEDYFRETDRVLRDKGKIYLSISYDTDLLALENILPYSKQWIEFARQRKNLTIELRTKSANYKAIQNTDAVENVILAWTLSPQTIINLYEKKTPSLKARLKSISCAVRDGWNVRLCFDPMLILDNWKTLYAELFEEVFSMQESSEIQDVSIGTFRMNSEYFKTLKSMRSDSDLLHFPYAIKNKNAGYSGQDKQSLLSFAREALSKYLPADKIFQI